MIYIETISTFTFGRQTGAISQSQSTMKADLGSVKLCSVRDRTVS